MEEKPTKAALIKEFYEEELETKITSPKASDVAGRITKQIKEMLLEENAETVSQLKANMGHLRRSLDELKAAVKEIKEADFQADAMKKYSAAKAYMDNSISTLENMLRMTVNDHFDGIKKELEDKIDEKVLERANSDNPFLNEVDGFMAIMRKYEAQEETVSDGLCALLNSLSFVYWKRIEASMEKNGKDTFTPYQRKAGRKL